MQSTQGQNNNCSTNINVISATENLHKGIAGRSNPPKHSGGNVEWEKMKKQTYAIGYMPQLLVKSTVTYKLMYESHDGGGTKFVL